MSIKPYKTKCDQERRQNPNRVNRWNTKYGCVVQFWGMRVYCGRCRDCAAPVTTLRDVSRHNWGLTTVGRWPELCENCRSKKREAHAEGARHRMAALRRERKQFRDAQFARAGLPPVRQGVRMGE